MILYDNDLDADAYPVRLLLSLLRLRYDRVTIDSSPLALRGFGPRGPVPRFAPRQARLLALFTTEGPPPGLVEEAAYRLQDLDDHLTLAEFDGQLWLAGERPTIVDVAAFPAAGLSGDYGVEQDAYPALRRWMRRFRALGGFIPMPGVPQFY